MSPTALFWSVLFNNESILYKTLIKFRIYTLKWWFPKCGSHDGVFHYQCNAVIHFNYFFLLIFNKNITIYNFIARCSSVSFTECMYSITQNVHVFFLMTNKKNKLIFNDCYKNYCCNLLNKKSIFLSNYKTQDDHYAQ